MALGVIPARLGSTRLPRKALLEVEGRPLIAWVVQAALAARELERVLVATDDEAIAAAARDAGVEACLTRADHPSGTDRIAEAIQAVEGALIVNIQGDEPEIEAQTIDSVVALLKNDPDLDMATAAVALTQRADWLSPHRVKVVCDLAGRALYFSRAPIPHPRDEPDHGLPNGPAVPLGHVGIYAYRRESLLELVRRPPSPLERCERLEQLRALQAGMSIGVVVVERAPAGIDTQEDLEAFRMRVRGR